MANSSKKISLWRRECSKVHRRGLVRETEEESITEKVFNVGTYCTKSQDSSNKLFSQSLLYSRETDSELFKCVECNLLIADSDQKKKI